MIDLDRYFARIGYRGERAPTLDVLHALTLAHASRSRSRTSTCCAACRSSSTSPGGLREARRLRVAAATASSRTACSSTCSPRSVSRWRRSARACGIGRPRDFTPPRTHVFVRVELEGESWLTDVGVGALSLTSAIRLDTADEQATPHEPRRIVREGGRLFHQVRLGDDWHDVCEFTLEEMPPIDRELGNWYTSAHPQSHFKNRLIVARAAPDGQRVTLLNDELRFAAATVTPTCAPSPRPTSCSRSWRATSICTSPGTRFGAPGSPWPA